MAFPDIENIAENNPISRARISSSPNAAPPGGQKRKRKAYSCYDCRRRKLKCDRELPCCGRCQKAGLASSCSYDVRPIETRLDGLRDQPLIKQSPREWSSNPPPQIRQFSGIENISNLEASQTSGTWQLMGEVSTLKDSEQRPAVKADSEKILRSPRYATPTETIIFRGENFKTQYYGGSNPTSLIAHFPELRSFMKEAITHSSSMSRVQRDLKALQERWKAEKANMSPLSNEELVQLLPSRETVDQLVRLYFDNFGPLYPIIHGPSFWKEYHMYWQDQEAAEPSFIIVIFLMMAAVSCLSLREQPTYIGDSAIAREQAVVWIETSDKWLSSHSQKNIYLAIWQIRCLLVMAKQVNIVKKKRTWTTAGNMVREAMSAGFHRDPSLLGYKVSVFDQEMRRRLWATMTELELQASIDRGMPSASAGVPSDTANVLNVNDEDLNVESGDPPVQKPSDDITAASYLHRSKTSFPLRVALNSMVNDTSSPSRYEEVLNYEEHINGQLKKLPPQGSPGLPGIVATLLDVQLRQFLILLHAPFARKAGTNPRYTLSRMVCFNAAASIIDQYSKLVKAGNHTLLLLRHDYLRAALAISHNLHIAMSIKSELALPLGEPLMLLLMLLIFTLALILTRILTLSPFAHPHAYTLAFALALTYAGTHALAPA
jgi:hypothetical protein